MGGNKAKYDVQGMPPMQMPPMNMGSMGAMNRRWLDDGESPDDFNFASSFVSEGPNTINIHSSTHQSGGDVHGKDGEANGAHGADAFSFSFSRRGQNGGDSNAGNSKTGGGNQANNQNSMNGANIGAGGTINMSNQNSQKG